MVYADTHDISSDSLADSSERRGDGHHQSRFPCWQHFVVVRVMRIIAMAHTLSLAADENISVAVSAKSKR
jgi:hypothetical protein